MASNKKHQNKTSILAAICCALLALPFADLAIAGPGRIIGRYLVGLRDNRTFDDFIETALRGEYPSIRSVVRFDQGRQVPGRGTGLVYRHRTGDGPEADSLRVQTLYRREGAASLWQSDFSIGLTAENFQPPRDQVKFLRPRANPNGDNPAYDGVQVIRRTNGFPDRTQNFRIAEIDGQQFRQTTLDHQMMQYGPSDVRGIKVELMLPGRAGAGEVPEQGRIVVRTSNFDSRMQSQFIDIPDGERALHVELVGEPATELLVVMRRADGTLYSQTRSIQSQFSFPVNPERELSLGEPDPPTTVAANLREQINGVQARDFAAGPMNLSDALDTPAQYRTDGGIGGMEIMEPEDVPEAR